MKHFSEPVLSVLNSDHIEHIITLDWETYYDDEFQLRKMTTEQYIRDPRFETIGVGVQVDNGPTVWTDEAGFRAWAATVPWQACAVLAHHCVPGDVEVLTHAGWARIDATPAGTKIMQWDPATSKLSWAVTTHKTSEVSKTMVKWRTNHHRCSYTPEHRMYYATPDRADWRVATASQVSEMSPNNIYIPTGGVFESEDAIALTPDEARLMEAIRADASWDHSRERCYGAQFNLGAETGKPARLRALATRLGLAFTERAPRVGVVSIRLLTSETMRRIYSLLTPAKQYEHWVLNLTVDARRAILDEARYWDGSMRKAAHSYQFACANEKTVEAFQLLAHSTGWSFSGAWRNNARGLSAHLPDAKIYTATVCEKPRAKLVERGETVDVQQPVYCFTVPTGAFLVRSEDRVFVTGNCHFDGLIASHHFGIRPGFWLCTLSMGRALHGSEVGGSLAKLSQAYGVGEKGHEVDNAKGKHRADFTPEEYARYGDYCKQDVMLTRAIFDKMVAGAEGRGVFPEVELWNIDSTIRMYTEPTFRLNRPLVEQFLVDERGRKLAFLERSGVDKKTLGSNDKFAALLEALGETAPRKPSPTAKNADGTPKETYAFAKTDPAMQELLEHADDEIRWLAEARVAIKSTTNETRAERFLSSDSRGPMPVYLRFSGAHTHRWSGGDKMNFQNLRRVDKKKPEVGVLRSALLAPDGWTLVVVDSAQIEARVIAWLADHHVMLAAFERNADIYSEFASDIFGRHVDRKKNDGQDGRPNDYIPGFIGKCSVLGLNFGMGWAKFGGTLLKGMLGGPSVQFSEADAANLGVNVAAFAEGHTGRERNYSRVEKIPSRISLEARLTHCAVAKTVVDRYRNGNQPITHLWKVMDEVLSAMVAGDVCEFKGLVTGRHSITKPGGLTLHYPGLRFGGEDGTDGEGYSYLGGQSGRERVRAYGGSITENVVQSLARDIVAEQCLWVRGRYGYHTVTMTHDEGVFLARENEAETALERCLDVFKTAPVWAQGMPLNAEGGTGRSYGEAK